MKTIEQIAHDQAVEATIRRAEESGRHHGAGARTFHDIRLRLANEVGRKVATHCGDGWAYISQKWKPGLTRNGHKIPVADITNSIKFEFTADNEFGEVIVIKNSQEVAQIHFDFMVDDVEDLWLWVKENYLAK